MTRDATSQHVPFGSGSGLAAVECPGNVQPVSKRYRTIVADPPWQYASAATKADARRHYATMSLAEIAAIPVDELADESAHLWLWTTNAFMEDAYWLVRSWRFRPMNILTWCKRQPGVGYYMRTNTEHAIFATRGAPMVPAEKPLATWHVWPRGEHSRKPDAFLDTVEQVSPGPYLELFARRQRLGWHTWGNEALGHVDLGGQSEDTDPLQARSGSQSA